MSDNHRANTALSFLIGAATGGLAAMLFAPMSGRELRSKIGDEADARKQAAEDKMRELTDLASNRVRELGERTSERVEKGRERAGEVVEKGRDAANVRKDAVAEAFRAGLEAYERTLRAS